MKTLLHSIIWCPDEQTARLETTRKHLLGMSSYTGSFDIYISVYEAGETLKEIIEEFKSSTQRNVLVEYINTNEGWGWGRNRAIKRTLENSYDLLCTVDGDIWVTDLAWVTKAQKASSVCPVFMCRMDEQKCRTGGKTKFMGTTFDLYDEWLGCINVFRSYVFKKVGGYNIKDLPKRWGFSDPLQGRSLMKEGYFKEFGRFYPSLAGLGVIEEQDKVYDASLQSMKDEVVNTYGRVFSTLEYEILSGARPTFFDYNYEQTEF